MNRINDLLNTTGESDFEGHFDDLINIIANNPTAAKQLHRLRDEYINDLDSKYFLCRYLTGRKMHELRAAFHRFFDGRALESIIPTLHNITYASWTTRFAGHTERIELRYRFLRWLTRQVNNRIETSNIITQIENIQFDDSVMIHLSPTEHEQLLELQKQYPYWKPTFNDYTTQEVFSKVLCWATKQLKLNNLHSKLHEKFDRRVIESFCGLDEETLPVHGPVGDARKLLRVRYIEWLLEQNTKMPHEKAVDKLRRLRDRDLIQEGVADILEYILKEINHER